MTFTRNVPPVVTKEPPQELEQSSLCALLLAPYAFGVSWSFLEIANYE